MMEKECKVTSMAAIVARVFLADFRGRNEQSVRVRENVLVFSQVLLRYSRGLCFKFENGRAEMK